MKKEFDFENLATRYGLPVEFVTELYEKVVDKDNFGSAVRMFADGTMPYDMATGKEPINVAELRHKIATELITQRGDQKAKVVAALEEQRKIVDYYNGCKALFLSKTDIWLPLPYLSRNKAVFTPLTMK